ncbi:MAG: hypothetical protein GY801_36355 [bacterium]|nr:hypothetical protein [bacterium]
MAEQELAYTGIEQDHKKGPGWFLILSYILVTLFCIYYLFANVNWKSNYDKQQETIRTELAK